MIALLCLWFGISVPLIFIGFYFGFRKQVLKSYLHVADGIQHLFVGVRTSSENQPDTTTNSRSSLVSVTIYQVYSNILGMFTSLYCTAP